MSATTLKYRECKQKSDKARLKAVNALMRTYPFITPFLHHPVKQIRVEYFGELASLMMALARFLDGMSRRLDSLDPPPKSYDEIFKRVTELLDDKTEAVVPVQDEAVVPVQEEDADSARLLLSLREPPPVCTRCTKRVRTHEFDTITRTCIRCIRHCAICDVSECNLLDAFVDVSSSSNPKSRVHVCSPCAAMIHKPFSCDRCQTVTFKPTIVNNYGSRPVWLCSNCVFTCPACKKSEVETGFTHRPNLTSGAIPASLNFCRRCFDRAERCMMRLPGAHVVGASSSQVGEAIKLVPESNDRHRAILRTLQSLLTLYGL